MTADVVIRADQLPITLVKQSAKILHSALSGGPNIIARTYISLLSFVSRRLPKRIGSRIENSVCQFNWPEMRFRPRIVSVGCETEIALIPHLGEFDQAALFTKTLDYEAPVFEWLMANAATRYELRTLCKTRRPAIMI